MRKEIRRERRVELAQEGFRYWDLIRWKTAENILPQEVLGNKLFIAELGDNTNYKINADSIIVVSTTEFRTFNPARDYLFPLPLNELSLNPKLVQNPNWYI